MVRTFELRRATTSGTDVVDITGELRDNLALCGVTEGTLVVFVPGSTGALTTIEFEPGAVADLKAALDRSVPHDIHYDHNAAWGDGNGYSHVRAALVGPSVSIPVVDGALCLGTWQQVVLLDFDNKPRTRRIIQQVIGEE